MKESQYWDKTKRWVGTSWDELGQHHSDSGERQTSINFWNEEMSEGKKFIHLKCWGSFIWKTHFIYEIGTKLPWLVHKCLDDIFFFLLSYCGRFLLLHSSSRLNSLTPSSSSRRTPSLFISAWSTNFKNVSTLFTTTNLWCHFESWA